MDDGSIPIKDGTVLNPVKCGNCPFREEGGIDLGEEKMEQIRDYLFKGTSHFCHGDQRNKTICRGGREFQLSMWHRLGFIEAPTNEALKKAMDAAGIKPKGHI